MLRPRGQTVLETRSFSFYLG